jgi:hypothetical protein
MLRAVELPTVVSVNIQVLRGKQICFALVHMSIQQIVGHTDLPVEESVRVEGISLKVNGFALLTMAWIRYVFPACRIGVFRKYHLLHHPR